MVREESRVRSALGESVERRGEKRLEVVVGGGCNQCFRSMACFFSRSGSSEEGRPRFEGTVIQAEETGWCEDGDVFVVRCSGRGDRREGGPEGGGPEGGGPEGGGPEGGGSESSRTWGWSGGGRR
jgi:hypothetical protein